MSEPATKMWSGRFREPLNKQFEEWQRSFPFDWRLLPHEVEASIAHARAIEAAGILTSEELLQMEQGLRAVSQSLENISNNEQAEDIHHFVELKLTKQIGDLALKLHTGRSRNEQIATDMRLFVRECDRQHFAKVSGMGPTRSSPLPNPRARPSCPPTRTFSAPSQSS